VVLASRGVTAPGRLAPVPSPLDLRRELGADVLGAEVAEARPRLRISWKR
jgi:hypothetical protein